MVFRWFSGQRDGSLPDFRVVVYTRQGCHLCEVAWDELRRWQERYRFALEAVDVDGDAGLRAKYDQCVPVVTFNGKVRFRGRVNPVLLKRLLEAEMQHAQNRDG